MAVELLGQLGLQTPADGKRGDGPAASTPEGEAADPAFAGLLATLVSATASAKPAAGRTAENPAHAGQTTGDGTAGEDGGGTPGSAAASSTTVLPGGKSLVVVAPTTPEPAAAGEATGSRPSPPQGGESPSAPRWWLLAGQRAKAAASQEGGRPADQNLPSSSRAASTGVGPGQNLAAGRARRPTAPGVPAPASDGAGSATPTGSTSSAPRTPPATTAIPAPRAPGASPAGPDAAPATAPAAGGVEPSPAAAARPEADVTVAAGERPATAANTSDQPDGHAAPKATPSAEAPSTAVAQNPQTSAPEVGALDGGARTHATASGLRDGAAFADARGADAAGPAAPRVTEQVARGLLQRGGPLLGDDTVTLQLEPEQLGRVEVRVVARGNRLEVLFTADTAEAERALRDGARELSRAIGSRGEGRWQSIEVKIDGAGDQRSRGDATRHGRESDDDHDSPSHDPSRDQQQSDQRRRRRRDA